ncbi:DUF2637 domain-containing protein [Actinomadura citrea]|uniref:DUF2637 domain-containing protein n=1 Tax=Actinomadura citrea TaxID=46158 RepID=UPI003CE53D8A
MSWDFKAERIAAEAGAERQRAEADAIRARTALEADAARQERRERRRLEAEARREAKRATRTARRAALGQRLRTMALPAVATGAPGVLAWGGQYQFGEETMRLGWLAPALPIAIEGGVLYAAYMAHKAIAEEVPPGRYRALTWTLAAIAAGMNYWHGETPEIGVMLGLASLLSIIQLEWTIALRKARARKDREGMDAAKIRQALVRRLRYPILSMQAAGIRSASGVDVEEAWRRAWIDRYGVGPDTSRFERRLGKKVLKAQREDYALRAVNGELSVIGGAIVSAAAPAVPGIEQPPALPLQDGFSEADQVLLGYGPGDSGDLLELPQLPPAPHEPSAAERLGEQSPRGGVDADEPADQPADQDRGEDRGGEQAAGEQAAGEAERPSPDSKARRRRWAASKAPKSGRTTKGGKGKRAKNAEYQKRLAAVRKLLEENPDAAAPDVTAQLKIPPASARRLINHVKEDNGTNRQGGEQ